MLISKRYNTGCHMYKAGEQLSLEITFRFTSQKALKNGLVPQSNAMVKEEAKCKFVKFSTIHQTAEITCKASLFVSFSLAT